MLYVFKEINTKCAYFEKTQIGMVPTSYLLKKKKIKEKGGRAATLNGGEAALSSIGGVVRPPLLHWGCCAAISFSFMFFLIFLQTISKLPTPKKLSTYFLKKFL